MWILFLFAVENVFERREMAEFLYDGTDCVFTEADVEERRRFFVLFIYFIFFWYLSGRFYWLVDRFRGRFRGRSFLSLFFGVRKRKRRSESVFGGSDSAAADDASVAGRCALVIDWTPFQAAIRRISSAFRPN